MQPGDMREMTRNEIYKRLFGWTVDGNYVSSSYFPDRSIIYFNTNAIISDDQQKRVVR
jgi:hypothetical protein